MTRLEVIRDSEFTSLNWDDECEVILTNLAFRQLAERLSKIADQSGDTAAHYLFDPEDETENPGYEERDIYLPDEED